MYKPAIIASFLTLLVSASITNAASLEEIPGAYPAPELVGIDGWINSPPLTIASLKGKVVLVDFWTYTCYNCINTLPHVIDLDKKYRDKGLVVIGVQAPEFDAEKDPQNVKNAVEKFGITYPVALDNHMKSWHNFSNQYWPAFYLIDKKGNVVYTHFGEGDYDITENNIKSLLASKEY